MLKGKNPYIDNLLVIIYYNITSKLIITENKIEFDKTYFFQGLVRYYNDIGEINRNNIEQVLLLTYKNLFLLLEIPYNRNNKYLVIKKIRLFNSILESRKNLAKLSEKYEISNFLEYYNEMIGKLNRIISLTTENKNIKMNLQKKKIQKKEEEEKENSLIFEYDLYNYCNKLVKDMINEIILNLIT